MSIAQWIPIIADLQNLIGEYIGLQIIVYNEWNEMCEMFKRHLLHCDKYPWVFVNCYYCYCPRRVLKLVARSYNFLRICGYGLLDVYI
jgi:hypothetical protein